MGQSLTDARARPIPDRPIRSLADVERLSAEPDLQAYKSCSKRCVWSGAKPATNCRPGFRGRSVHARHLSNRDRQRPRRQRQFIAEQPSTWHAPWKTADATVGFVVVVIGGASAYQLFDSREVSPLTSTAWSQLFHQRLFIEIGGLSIIFVKDAPYMDLLVTCGTAISLGKHHDLARCETIS